MSRQLTAMILFIISLVVISWSTDVVAAEEAEKDPEARLLQLEEQIQEIEHALEQELSEEKAAALEGKLEERRRELDQLMDEVPKSKKPRGDFPEIQAGIQHAKVTLEELRHAVKASKEEGGNPEKLEGLQEEIHQEERKLEKLNALLRERRAGGKRRKQKPRTELMFFRLERANAQNLSEIIREFLGPSAIVVGDPDSNILVIKATGNDLEIASMIVKNLDVPRKRVARDQPRRRREQRERADRGNVFFGKVLEAGKKSLTIKTRDSGETVTLYVPLRRKEDGTRVPNEELSMHVASFDLGTDVKVQWRQGEERRLIQRVTSIKEEAERREREARWEVFLGEVLEAGKKSITIKTRDSGETVTIHVPLRKKEDGTRVPNEELSIHVASFDVGANVKVQWQWDEEKRWIRRVTRIEE